MTPDDPRSGDRPPEDDPRAATPLRMLSLIAVGVVFVLYRPGADPGVLHTLVLPLLGLLAGWYLTRSLLVIALAVALLAGAHADLSSASIMDARVYPLLSVAATILLLGILFGRFRRAVTARRRMRRGNDREETGKGP